MTSYILKLQQRRNTMWVLLIIGFLGSGIGIAHLSGALDWIKKKAFQIILTVLAILLIMISSWVIAFDDGVMHVVNNAADYGLIQPPSSSSKLSASVLNMQKQEQQGANEGPTLGFDGALSIQ